MASIKDKRLPHLVFFFVLSSVLTHILVQIKPISAAGTAPASETTSSSQPLWSYQVKPNSYVNVPASQPGHYSPILDAFNGLSQRQGALSGSPFLSILPIILIAAGGMLLLLPMLTMMIASPFSGGFGGGYNNGFGYPQVGALNKKRSLSDQFGQRGLVDLIEHVSSSIEEMTRKYSNQQAPNGQPQSNQKRAKSMNPQATLTNEPQVAANMQSSPVNHKSTNEESANLNSASNLLSS